MGLSSGAQWKERLTLVLPLAIVRVCWVWLALPYSFSLGHIMDSVTNTLTVLSSSLLIGHVGQVWASRRRLMCKRFYFHHKLCSSSDVLFCVTGAQDGDGASAAAGTRPWRHLGGMVCLDTLLQVLRRRRLHSVPRMSNELQVSVTPSHGQCSACSGPLSQSSIATVLFSLPTHHCPAHSDLTRVLPTHV